MGQKITEHFPLSNEAAQIIILSCMPAALLQIEKIKHLLSGITLATGGSERMHVAPRMQHMCGCGQCGSDRQTRAACFG